MNIDHIKNPSSVTPQQMNALQNYRRYLEHEFRYLQVQSEKDEAELDLMQLKIYEAMINLQEQREMLNREFHRMEGQLISERDLASQVEEKNICKIRELKDQYRYQEELRKLQNELRSTADTIIRESGQTKVQVDSGNMETGVYGRMAGVQLSYRDISMKIDATEGIIKNQRFLQNQRAEQLNNYESQMDRLRLKRIKLEENKEKSMKMIERKKQIIDEKKISIGRRVQEEKKIEKNMRSCMEKIKIQESVTEKLQAQKDSLCSQLQVILKDLQIEERNREADEDKLTRLMIQKGEDQALLFKLTAYLNQLRSTQNYLTHISRQNQKKIQYFGLPLKIKEGGENQTMSRYKRAVSSSRKTEMLPKKKEPQNDQATKSTWCSYLQPRLCIN